MTELLTAAQMRTIEGAAIESGEVTGLELMERAGRGVVAAVLEAWPAMAQAPHKAVVLCGPGNNGGDGFVVARLLTDRGWDVSLYLLGDPGKLPPDAKMNFERWQAVGEVGDWSDIGAGPAADLVVDGLFGTGLTRPVAEEVVAPLRRYASPGGEAGGARIVAIDIASGLDADSGVCLGAAARADLTVTFHRAKLGHYLGDGPACSGSLTVCDIGLSAVPRDTVRLSQPSPAGKQSAGHKYSHGHALILSGGAGRTGAARLAARGALRIGAGLVTLGVPGSAQMEVANQITAVMLRRAGTPDELAGLLDDSRLNTVCLGPGLGVERARDLVPVALRAGHAPRVVLDADALTSYSEAPEALFAMLHSGCVLTPHAGEFARLFPDIAEKLNGTPRSGPAYSKVDATREAAQRAGCLVLFKGPDTVIAAPDGRCSVNSAQYDRAAPWLATAGAGDVLSGFIAGLLARGFDPMKAAETAAWLHVDCARRFGPGLIAEDLPEQLPGAFRELGH